MITKEMYEDGIRCKGKRFNCETCNSFNNCVEYEKPTKRVKVKNKSYIIEKDPVKSSIIVTNDQCSFFRAFRGQKLNGSQKKYVAYIHEIVEEL